MTSCTCNMIRPFDKKFNFMVAWLCYYQEHDLAKSPRSRNQDALQGIRVFLHTGVSEQGSPFSRIMF